MHLFLSNANPMASSSSSSSAFKIKCVVFVCLMFISGFKDITVEAKTVAVNTSSYPVPVATLTYPALQKKYDVFVSFRGSDVRQGFVSHLTKALSRKQIVPFVDEKLERGEDLSPALLGAIQRSLISLVIFSQDYASSIWCLKELEKIVECREKDGQILLPVFYNVDPSDVRYQKGTYGDAFAKHEKRYSEIRLQIWRTALKESANIVGFHSSKYRNDAELLEEIVQWVSMRLNHMHQVNSKENKKNVVFWNCLKLDEHSLRTIVLNVQINLMNFAYQHLSALGLWDYVGFCYEDCDEEFYYKDYDAKATYVYPGSRVPGWLVYRTTQDYITIDLSSAPYSPQLGFIFCFIVPRVPTDGLSLKFSISIGEDDGDGDGEGEGDSISMYVDRPRYGITSDHVCLIYDQRCSRYLNSRAKDQPRFNIKVTAVSLTGTTHYTPVLLKGFGVHPIHVFEYHDFIEQIELVNKHDEL